MFQRRLAVYSQYIDLNPFDFSEVHQWLVNMQCLDTSKHLAELNGHHWDEVEAFLMQREFDTYVSEHHSVRQPSSMPEIGLDG